MSLPKKRCFSAKDHFAKVFYSYEEGTPVGVPLADRARSRLPIPQGRSPGGITGF